MHIFLKNFLSYLSITYISQSTKNRTDTMERIHFAVNDILKMLKTDVSMNKILKDEKYLNRHRLLRKMIRILIRNKYLVNIGIFRMQKKDSCTVEVSS